MHINDTHLSSVRQEKQKPTTKLHANEKIRTSQIKAICGKYIMHISNDTDIYQASNI